MLQLAIAMSLAQPGAAFATQPAPAIPFVILGDETRRSRLKLLLEDLARTGVANTPAAEGGMGYVGCVSTWRDNSAQAIACVQSRLVTDSRGRTIVLNTYERAERSGDTVVGCIGSGGRGAMTLRFQPEQGELLALRNCLEGAARPGATVSGSFRSVRSPEEFTIADAAQARASAAGVLTIAMDHVGIPRGNIGSCLIQGRVVGVVRGAGLSPEGRIAFSLPCSGVPGTRGPRRMRMGDLQEGSFAHVYLSERDEVVDLQPVVP